MASMNENERVEYSVLMSRGRDAERTSHFCWIASGIAATMLLSWAVAARNDPRRAVNLMWLYFHAWRPRSCPGKAGLSS